MRIQGGIICEKVAKLVNGRAVAYGIFSGHLQVAPADRGRTTTLGALMHLSMGVGAHEVTLRMLLPDGEVRDMPPLRVECDGVGHVEVIMDNHPVALSRPGTLTVQVRCDGGIWKDAARLAVTFQDAPDEAGVGAAGLLAAAGGLPN